MPAVTGDPWRKVRPGEALVIPAEVWNALLDVARPRGTGTDTTADYGVWQTGIRKAKNNSGSDRERFDVLTIGSPIFGPGDNLNEFKNNAAFVCTTPSATTDNVVILLEPVAAGKYARAAFDGYAVVRLDVADAGHLFANPIAGDATKLRTGSTGLHRVLWKNTTTTTVTLGLNNVTDPVMFTAGAPPFAATPFYIRVENEILLVTSTTGILWTVSRAQQGTSAAAHADGSVIRLVPEWAIVRIGDPSGSGGTTHNLLDAATHTDTVTQGATKGSLVVGNDTPKWDELVVGTDGHVLTADSTLAKGVKWAASPAAAPGGADQDVQYNDAGAFGGESTFTYNETTNVVTMSGAAPTAPHGSGSERWGASASASGANSLSVGNAATSTGARATCVGRLATTGAQVDAVAVGYNVTVSGDRTIAVGVSIGTIPEQNVAIGYNVSMTAGSSQSVAIGYFASTAADFSVSIGYQTSAAFASSGALGNLTATTTTGQLAWGAWDQNPALTLQRASAALTTSRDVGGLLGSWATSTDGSRAGRVELGAYSVTTFQVGVEVEANSGGVRLGFFDVTPVVRQSGSVSTGLVNLGLFSAANTTVDVRKNSTGSTFTRRRLNFIPSSNMSITVADDSVDDEVDLTFAATLNLLEADGTPNIAVFSLAFHQDDGFVLSEPVAGVGLLRWTKLTTKGDLLSHDGSVIGRLGVGTNSYVLTADSAETLGVKWAPPSAATAHNLLDTTAHPDTTTGTVARGDLITGQTASPTWTRLAIGAAGTILRSDGTDAAWSTGTLDSNARVAVRKNSTGSDFTRRRLNLIEGTNVTLTVADDSANEEVDVTIAASGGGSAHNLLDGSTHSDTVAATVAKGSLVVGNATPKWDDLAVGSNNQVLLADSAQTLGVKWGAPRYSGCLARRGSNQSITNNSDTAINFDFENFDTDSYHDTSTNNTRLVVPSNGLYLFHISVKWEHNASGYRHVRFLLNGGTGYARAEEDPRSGDPPGHYMHLSSLIKCTAGDYMEVLVYQNSGGSLNIVYELWRSPYFYVVRMGDDP